MLNQLSDSIYYMSNDNDRERPVLGLVCGEKHSLVIDGGNSVQHARDFIEEIRCLDVPPHSVCGYYACALGSFFGNE